MESGLLFARPARATSRRRRRRADGAAVRKSCRNRIRSRDPGRRGLLRIKRTKSLFNFCSLVLAQCSTRYRAPMREWADRNEFSLFSFALIQHAAVSGGQSRKSGANERLRWKTWGQGLFIRAGAASVIMTERSADSRACVCSSSVCLPTVRWNGRGSSFRRRPPPL